MLSNISLQQIRYFIAVAEFKSISRASEFLHTSQSTVSKSIALLEKNMEVSLFRREKKKLHLTEAGVCVYQKWRESLNFIYQGIDEARLLAGGLGTTVNVGVLDSHNPNLMVLPATEFFHQKYPNYDTVVANAHGYDISKNLLHHKLDVVFRIRYDVSEYQGDILHHEPVAESPFVVCMHKKNPLAHKKNIRWTDLKSCKWIIGSPVHMPYYRTMIQTNCDRWGYQPQISKVVDNANSMIYNLREEKEIFICDKFWRDYENSGYCWKVIEESRGVLMMEYRKDNQKPEVLKFAEAVHEMIIQKTGEAVIKL